MQAVMTMVATKRGSLGSLSEAAGAVGSTRHWPHQPACDRRGGPGAGAPGAALPPACLRSGWAAGGRERGGKGPPHPGLGLGLPPAPLYLPSTHLSKDVVGIYLNGAY